MDMRKSKNVVQQGINGIKTTVYTGRCSQLK